MAMDADELRLRERVHATWDAVAYDPTLRARVLDGVHARVQRRAQARWTLAAVGVAMALLVLAVTSVELALRGAHVSPPVSRAQGEPTARSTDGTPTTCCLNSDGTGTNGQLAGGPPTPRPTLAPCAPQDLLVSVNTDRDRYSRGDLVFVTTTVTNRGQHDCSIPQGPTVWISSSDRSWRLCPEAPPPPTPTPSPRPGSTPTPFVGSSAEMPGGTYNDFSTGPHPYQPGDTLQQTCEWHTSYTMPPPGTYTAHAQWDDTAATTRLTLGDSSAADNTTTPAATPTPAPPTPTPSLIPIPPLP